MLRNILFGSCYQSLRNCKANAVNDVTKRYIRTIKMLEKMIIYKQT